VVSPDDGRPAGTDPTDTRTVNDPPTAH